MNLFDALSAYLMRCAVNLFDAMLVCLTRLVTLLLNLNQWRGKDAEKAGEEPEAWVVNLSRGEPTPQK